MTTVDYSDRGYKYPLDEEHCKLGFDPTTSNETIFRDLFANPIAWPLWAAYRRCHIVDQHVAEWLPKNCLLIAQQIQSNIFIQEAVKGWSDEALKAWLWPRLSRGTHFGMSGDLEDQREYVRFIRPYLTGGKVASYSSPKE